MSDVESVYEVIDDSGTTIGNVNLQSMQDDIGKSNSGVDHLTQEVQELKSNADLQSMQDEIVKSNRTIEHLKQEMQQLKSQVQRTQTQLKVLESRIARR
jgi:peptidoglycan hydrolase CwlO-like protein